jgi:hypothetical protein
MSCLSRSSALALVLVAAGCGGDPARPAAARPGPCARHVVAALGGHVHTRVTGYSPGQATCVYETRDTRIEVMVDNNPQVPFRFQRAVVERGQNAIWGHDDAKAPVQLHGIGGGADWFPADNQLLAVGRKLLITVSVVRPASGGLGVAKRAARATIASNAVPGRGSTLR